MIPQIGKSVRWDGTNWQPWDPPVCHVRKAAPQNVNNAALTLLTFDTEKYDTDNMHDNAVNPSRVTVVTAGVYSLKASIDIASNATGQRALYLYKNGAALWYDSRNAAGGGFGTDITVTYDEKLAAGDYIEAQTYQNSAATLAVAAELSVAYLGLG